MSAPGAPDHGHGAPNLDELDPDEPRTPLWLPLLGLALFLAALIYMLVGGSDKPATADGAAAGSASAAASAAPPPG